MRVSRAFKRVTTARRGGRLADGGSDGCRAKDSDGRGQRAFKMVASQWSSDMQNEIESILYRVSHLVND